MAESVDVPGDGPTLQDGGQDLSVTQIAVEPVEHPGHPVDPPIGSATRREDVSFLRVEHILDGPPEVTKRDEELLVVVWRTAQVGFGLEQSGLR